MRKIIALSFLILVTACGTELSPAETKLSGDVGIDKDIAKTIRAHGNAIERLMGLTEEYESFEANGIVLSTTKNSGEAVLEKLREELEGTPYAAYMLDQGFGLGPDSIAIVTNSDPYDYLKTVRVNGINYDVDHPDVIERYRTWDELYGLELVGAGMDWLFAEFEASPSDWNAFAREVYEFCPDVVDQGTGTVELLASEMQNMNAVYLWWD